MDMEKGGAHTIHILDYLDLEIRQSPNQGKLSFLGRQEKGVLDNCNVFGNLLVANDFESFVGRLRWFFAGIPWQWQGSYSPTRNEAWYAGVLYACFHTIDLDLRVEDSSKRGRANMVVRYVSRVFVFECKMADGKVDQTTAAKQVIAQIRVCGHIDKTQIGKNRST